jgi:SAM-dependent methyltransferase
MKTMSLSELSNVPERPGANPDYTRVPIPLSVPATLGAFDEAGYLDANSDVRAAVESGQLPSGRVHFEAMGQYEGRYQRLPAVSLTEARRVKIDRLRPFLRPDMPSRMREGRLDYLTRELRAATRIADTENVSANGYDATTLEMIERCGGGLVLDCGAGRRDVYHHNVVNYEIVAYDTTDVIGVGEALPFLDNSFDAVISIAVLEHVRDPFRCAAEIARILKPGGQLLCSVPFLQPLHGYPHHYFNATHQGLRRLFEDDLQVESVVVPHVGHPAFALHWILNSWAAGLPPDAKEDFQTTTTQSKNILRGVRMHH